MRCDCCGYLFYGAIYCYDFELLCAPCHEGRHRQESRVLVLSEGDEQVSGASGGDSSASEMGVRGVREGPVDNIPDEWKVKGPWW